MPETLLDELSPTDNVDMHKLGSKEIDAFRQLRWKARTDLLFLAREVLKKDRISREFNGPLIDKLQKFPSPTLDVAKTNDRWTNDGWLYTPIIEYPSNLPGKKRRLFIDFRSSYKTTLNCECHTIQWLLNYPTVCIALFQYKLEKAETILKAVKEHFLTNNLFRALFPELCPPAGTTPKQFGNAGKFSVANINKWRKTPRREDSVMAAALEAGLAGYHFEVMKFSDVVDTENSENEDQCIKTIHKFGQSKYLLVDPSLHYIDTEGTRYHFADLYGKIIEDHKVDLADCGGDESKAAWDIYCRGIFKVRKNDADMKFTPDELELPPILGPDGKRIPWDVPSEPKRFPLQGLEREERIDPANFSAQMRNVPFSGRSGVSDFILATNAEGKKDLPTKNVIPGKAYDKIPMSYTIVSVDPAETTTERSNHTAICVATLDRHGRVYIKDIIIGKWNPTDVGRQILAACDKHLPEYLCLEEVSATRNLLPYIAREWDLGYKHHRPTVKFNKRDTKLKKEEKIRLNLHSPFEIGDLRFVSDRIDPVGFNHLILELSQFPKGGKDDILDALSEIYAARTWFGQEFARPQKPGEFLIHHIDPGFVRMYQEAAFKAEFDGEELFPDPREQKSAPTFPTISPSQLNDYYKKVGGL